MGSGEYLQEFFAVTQTSVYRVTEQGPYAASAVKIALKGESKMPVGEELAGNGRMIAITKCLQAFIPEKYGIFSPQTGFERNIENVNTVYWAGSSSPIVALFETEEEAMGCFNCDGFQISEAPEWLASTKHVLEMIGDDHPSFSVCKFRGMMLVVD